MNGLNHHWGSFRRPEDQQQLEPGVFYLKDDLGNQQGVVHVSGPTQDPQSNDVYTENWVLFAAFVSPHLDPVTSDSKKPMKVVASTYGDLLPGGVPTGYEASNPDEPTWSEVKAWVIQYGSANSITLYHHRAMSTDLGVLS